MSDCKEHIEQIYKHPKIKSLISNIKPKELQDDLIQEFAIVLLEYDCNKLLEIYESGKLISFAMSIIWKMGTLTNGNFYKTFKKSHTKNAAEYLHSLTGKEIPQQYIIDAMCILENKMLIDSNEAHESILFMKYVELQSCTKVAEYFGIPRLHAYQVINNVKKELKKKIRK